MKDGGPAPGQCPLGDMQHRQVRPAVERDLTAIAALDARTFPGLSYPYFTLRQLFDVHGRHMLVAADARGLYGYVLLAGDGNGRSWRVGIPPHRAVPRLLRAGPEPPGNGPEGTPPDRIARACRHPAGSRVVTAEHKALARVSV